MHSDHDDPGFVAMRRGRLSQVQAEVRRDCPGSDIVMCAHQIDDLQFSVMDFSARTRPLTQQRCYGTAINDVLTAQGHAAKGRSAN